MSVNEVKLKPAPFELEVRGTGHPGSRTFAIGDEDHTLGNAVRHVLMNNSRIAFAGYSVPHPSEPVVHIRVQTAKISQKDKESDRPRAVDLLKEACETLGTQCDIVIDQIEGIMPEVEKDRIAIEDALKQDSLNEDGEDAAQEEADDFDEEMMDGTEEY
jgi:DNA-directed RNA polymerase I and III subunit RPAC2